MNFKHYLFDWGDTLMVDQAENQVPMSEWQEVCEVPGAKKLLAILNKNSHCYLATNSMSTNEQQIRKALSRVGLNQYIEKIYCYRTLGLKKPQQEFYDHILNDLGASRSELIMIGDGLEKDVIGALDNGIQAIWYNPKNDPVPENIHAIGNLLELTKYNQVIKPQSPHSSHTS